MRPTLLFAVALATACGSARTAPPSSSTPPSQTVRVAANPGTGNMNSTIRTTATYDVRIDTLPLPLERIWKALPSVFAALEIPISQYDAEHNTIGNSGMKVYRRLGKTPLTKILDCGRTQIGPSADSYEIFMSVLTTLRSLDAANTVIFTNIEATAKPMQYIGGDTRCRTVGSLEREVGLLLRTRLLPQD